jgi:PAS domain S-box-containing protein
MPGLPVAVNFSILIMASTPSRGRIGLPDQRTLLGWLFAFRIALATLLLVRASFVWSDRPENSFYVASGVLLFFVITGYGAYQILLKRLAPSVGFFITQALADLTVVSALVRIGGEASTALAAMYVVVIAVYALLMPTWAGITVALAAGLAYVIASLWANDNTLPPGLWGQIIVFGFVFLLVAVLGHRLQHSVVAQDRLESELQRVRFEAEEVLRSLKTGVITVDGNGRLAFVNPAGERLLGLGSPATMGQPVVAHLGQVAPELQAAITAGLERGHRVARGEGTVHGVDGRDFPIGLSTTTFAQAFDGLPAVTALFTDLSDHKQLQELHLRAERLEAVAALSASLAHEIRNPLASIRSSVEQLALSAQADDDERTLGRLIVRESDRLSRLLGEFLDFSRVRAVRFAPVNLFAVASETARLVRERPECEDGLHLEVRGEATLIEADEDLLHRVVSNLTINAVQACKGKGTVTITVGPAHPGDLPPGADLEMPVQLIVRDDGPGIDPDLIDRLFEPFVSRRAGGSGLGLAIVQRAVEAHRGLVLVDSTPGKGARFTVYLPSRPFRESTA